jgi:hypothetical protein
VDHVHTEESKSNAREWENKAMASTQKAEQYNGWANYQTWNVVLWLRNDGPMYRTMQAEGRIAAKLKGSIGRDDAKSIAYLAMQEDI